MDLATKIICTNKRSRLLLQMAQMWDDIAGAMAQYSMPSNLRYIGDNRVALTVSVVTSACTIFSYNIPNISDKIKILFSLGEVEIRTRQTAHMLDYCYGRKDGGRGRDGRGSGLVEAAAVHMSHSNNNIAHESLHRSLDNLYTVIQERHSQ